MPTTQIQPKAAKSQLLALEAAALTPGGVHSSTRGLDPRIVWKEAKGSILTDVDGRQYIDYHAAFGPTILGHRDPVVDQRVIDSMGRIDLLGVGTPAVEVRSRS